MTLVERLRDLYENWGLGSKGPAILKEAADRIESLEAELEKAREALEEIGIGGNHLAHQLVTRVGPGFSEEYLPEDDPEIVLRRLGATVEYDMWCAWAAIMRARRRAALSHKEG